MPGTEHRARTAAAVRVTDGGARRVYTRRLRTVHVAMLVFTSSVVAIGPASEFGADDPAVRTTIVVLAAVAGVLGCVALTRRAVVVTPGLITIRGLLTTRRIPAEDVVGFEPPVPYGKVVGRVALRVRLVDGRAFSAGVFANTPLDRNRAGRHECDELRRWLALENGRADRAEDLPQRHDPAWARALWASWLCLLTLLALFCALVVVASLTDPAVG